MNLFACPQFEKSGFCYIKVNAERWTDEKEPEFLKLTVSASTCLRRYMILISA